jgi:type IV secretory pathway VirB10-like protein
MFTITSKLIYIIITIVSGLLIVALVAWLKSSDSQPEVAKEQIVVEDTHIASDFFVLPEKKPEEVVILEQKRIPEPEASEVFKTIAPSVDIAKISEEMKLRKLQAQRKEASIDASGLVFSKSNGNGQIEGVKSSYDKDFSEHEIDTTIATFPVNLERVLTADKIIEATLTTEIKSELGSEKVKAQVVRDVYASHGNKILIPWGTVVIGKYVPLKKDGDTRLNIHWYRMITPNGINIVLDAEVADSTGSAGITGDVDDRFKEKYGSAMLLATIAAAGQMVVPVGKDTYQATANSYSDALSNVTAEAIKKSFDLTPKVRINRGERIYISPLQDLHFKKPKGNVIEVEPVDYERG